MTEAKLIGNDVRCSGQGLMSLHFPRESDGVHTKQKIGVYWTVFATHVSGEPSTSSMHRLRSTI